MQVNELLDPPAFSPEAGRRLKDEDRDQDITYASSAQLPELLDRDFDWDTLSGSQMSFAYQEGVKLIVTNKGRNGTGFGVCETCGAAWLSDDPEAEKEHLRPFLLFAALGWHGAWNEITTRGTGRFTRDTLVEIKKRLAKLGVSTFVRTHR